MSELTDRRLERRLRSTRAPAAIRPAEVTVLAVDSWQVLKILVSIIAALTVASTVAALSLWLFEWPEGSFGYALVELFWLDTEQNIPTLYQCSALFAASVLSILVGRRSSRAGAIHGPWWYALAGLFAFLGIDEGAQLHESVGDVIKAASDTTFGASWSLIYVPVALAVLAALVPFLLRLPARTRWLLVLSGAVYVGGSVAVEIAGQVHAGFFGQTNPVYAGLATIEEVLEMLGVALLIFTLLEHLRTLPQPRGTIMSRPAVNFNAFSRTHLRKKR